MKNLLFITCFAVLTTANAFASHLMGGEITWKCQANGSFKFTMKVYRDCNGIPFTGTGESLSSTHPNFGANSIPLTLVTSTDISPQGPGCFPCDHPNNNAGETKEFIMQSGDIFLNGTPPPQGWVFYWGSCCRNTAIDNLQNASSQGFTLRAIMYSYNSQNTNPCFDSSPYFAEKPNVLICTRSPYNYIHSVLETDLDSLSFEWGQPLGDGLWPPLPLPFFFPYSYNNPLPQPMQNPSNVAAVMNSLTGEVSFTSYTQGEFVIVTKVTSYKCGAKISEVFREIQITLINCIIDSGPPVLYNTSPDADPPFINPVSGLYEFYTDTVSPGDTVQFFLNATDLELLSNGNPQSVTITAFGSQFGTGYTDSLSGCLLPPCATLSPAPPVSGVTSAGIGFQWQIHCNHLLQDSIYHSIGPKIYTFNIASKDDFCPANSIKNSVITIVVNPDAQCTPPGAPCIVVGDDYEEPNALFDLEILTHINEIEIQFNLNENTNLEFHLIDIQGRPLQQRMVYGIPGKNSIRLSSVNLQPGIYLIQMKSGNVFFSRKVALVNN